MCDVRNWSNNFNELVNYEIIASILDVRCIPYPIL
jgi:hypothetical protein